MRIIVNALIAATVVVAFTCAGVALTASPAEAQGKGKSMRSGGGAANATTTTRSGNRSGSRTNRSGTKGLSGHPIV
jgi:hypothetical protein